MALTRTGLLAALAGAVTIPLVAQSRAGAPGSSPAPAGQSQTQSLVEYDDDVRRSTPNGVDFTGEWAPRFHEDEPERVPGPELGDYLGIPINDAARLRAASWEASIQTLPEWQCRPHSADYIWRGPSPLRIWKEVDPVSRQVTAWHAEWLRSVDVATLTEHWMLHGDVLTVATIVTDPVYLTEPFIRTTDYELDLHQWVPPYPCQVVEEVERPRGVVPHSLPGTNAAVADFARRCGLPVEATRGGAETMYPDFREKIGNITSTCIAAQR